MLVKTVREAKEQKRMEISEKSAKEEIKEDIKEDNNARWTKHSKIIRDKRKVSITKK